MKVAKKYKDNSCTLRYFKLKVSLTWLQRTELWLISNISLKGFRYHRSAKAGRDITYKTHFPEYDDFMLDTKRANKQQSLRLCQIDLTINYEFTESRFLLVQEYRIWIVSCLILRPRGEALVRRSVFDCKLDNEFDLFEVRDLEGGTSWTADNKCFISNS